MIKKHRYLLIFLTSVIVAFMLTALILTLVNGVSDYFAIMALVSAISYVVVWNVYAGHTLKYKYSFKNDTEKMSKKDIKILSEQIQTAKERKWIIFFYFLFASLLTLILWLILK